MSQGKAVTVPEIHNEISRAYFSGNTLAVLEIIKEKDKLQNPLIEEALKRFIRFNIKNKYDFAEKEAALINFLLKKCGSISSDNRKLSEIITKAWSVKEYEHFEKARQLQLLSYRINSADCADTITKSNLYFEKLGCRFMLTENEYARANFFYRIRQYDSSIFYINRALQEVRQEENIVANCRFHIFKATLLSKYPDSVEAYQTCLDRALNIARSHKLHNLEIDYYNNYANQLYYLGSYREAIRQFKASDSICFDHSQEIRRLYPLKHIALCYQKLNQNNEADSIFETALQIARSGEAPVEAAWIILYQSDYRLSNKDTLGIRAKLMEAKEIFIKNNKSQQELAHIYYHLGHLEIIAANYNEAIGYLRYSAELFNAPRDRVYSLIKLGLAFLYLGNADSSMYYLTEAEKDYNRVRSSVPNSSLRKNYLKGKNDLVLGLVSAHLKNNDIPLAFETAESYWARSFYENIMEMKTGIKISRDNLEKKNHLDQEITDIFKLVRNCPDISNDSLYAVSRLVAIQDTLLDIAFHTNPESKGKADLTVSAGEFVRSFDDGQVGILYGMYQESIFCWYTFDKKLFFENMTENDKSLIDSLDNVIKLIKRPPRFQSERNRLNGLLVYLQKLIPEEILTAIENINKITIIPSGKLTYFPFETIRFKDNFICEKTIIEYYPSLCIRSYLKKSSTETERLDHVFIFGGTFKNERSVNCPRIEDISASYQNLSPLSGVAREIMTIKELYPDAHSYADGWNQETFLKQLQPSSADILHFATHGVILENYPEYSGLALPYDSTCRNDEILLTGEISRLTLNNALTVLSACRSGSGEYITGEGIQGLTKSFIIAGSRSLVVSLWPLNDRAGSEFMGHFYKALKENQSTAGALQSAREKFINHDIFNHPYYWASLIAIGNWKSE